MKEVRVYVLWVDAFFEKFGDDARVESINKEEFVEEAERLGMVYSLQGFQNAFNFDTINSYDSFILITDEFSQEIHT